VGYFSILNNLFLGQNCCELFNYLGRKYLSKPYFALWQIFLHPKALKTAFQKAKKGCVTFRRTPRPP
jgi:hypothetical protein